ncbi:MAG: DUF1592 domain-containing protein [Acidimicrobiia bacterium]|nr:DUF1592 domain-containing protein [Acidimicrobiia bacterium]
MTHVKGWGVAGKAVRGSLTALGVAGAAVAGALWLAPGASAQAKGDGAVPAVEPHQRLVTRYCVTCHSDRLQTGGLSLEHVDLADVPAGAAVWEKVIAKLRTASMPPPQARRPDDASRIALAEYLEQAIDAAAARYPIPGRTESLHRLNRTEYQNVIRDLLDLDIDVSSLLPADDQSYGFDNIAGILKLSPTLLDRYMNAAREISSLAVGASARRPVAETFRLRSDYSQYEHLEGLPLGTRGGIAVDFTFPRDGEYEFKVEMLEFVVGTTALRETHDLEIAVDGERIALFTLEPLNRALEYQEKAIKDRHVRTAVKAGPRRVTVAFVHKTAALSEGLRSPFSRPHGEGDYLYWAPHVETFTITGPFDGTGMARTPSRERIFTCHPSNGVAPGACANEIVSTLARRAYRRPVTEADVAPLMAFYEEGRADGGFEAGIERAVRAILVSPDFLIRVEADPASMPADGYYRIRDLDLASRLSFFLWSSIPDDELLDLAAAGRLGEDAVLDAQVRRMLADPRSVSLSTNFASQWLRLRNVEGTQPNNVKFPNFSENLRQDFVTETELFFDSIVRENGSVLELLMADHTFLNERLAKYYGVPGVYGSDFRRVRLTDDSRRGLLGKAAILLVTSYPDRTSPVIRGKWILENVLGTPPPAPPANVPPLEPTGDGVVAAALTMRERMVQHRANPVCASCHSRMDPLGLAMENFDAVGRWREVDESGNLVDASGAMPNGQAFSGPAELRGLLVENPERFVTVVTEKLLTYALGRGVGYYDAPAIRTIVRNAARDDYRFAAVVVGIVKSLPFRLRGAEAPPEPLSAAAH